MTAAPLLAAQAVSKSFGVRRGLIALLTAKGGGQVQALNGVDLTVARGETLGLIGESGCGKSTLARVLLRLQRPTAGRILFDGVDITESSAKALKAFRRRAQIVLQDPYASLNPRKTVGEIVGLPLKVHEGLSRRAARPRVAAMLSRVGLRPDYIDRYPHQFSGGQRQRISVARALIAEPELLICDEPVSALDASVQAQILTLFQDLRRDLGLTYLFISHNLAVIGHVSDRVAVMYLGEIVEIGPTRAVLAAPSHPYTQMLLAALPRLDRALPRRPPLRALDPPSPLNPPPGCRFHTRCPMAQAVCVKTPPPLRPGPNGRLVACHFAPPADPPPVRSSPHQPEPAP